MDLGLAGKVALCAASSRGLGRAVAHELAAEGARLVLCARGAEDLAATREEIVRSTGAEVVAVTADLSDPDEVARLVGAGVAEFGRIDVLVTNTGGPPAGPFESHPPEVWQQAVQSLLGSVLALTRAVLPGMKDRRWGRIVNVTSVAVKQPVANLILSNSVRAAVTGFARTLANEVAPFGVTVNNVLPGYTRTARLEELAQAVAGGGDAAGASAVFAGWEAQIPMRRLGEPRELAALCAFLCSERASYVTGASIAVDGGWTRALY